MDDDSTTQKHPEQVQTEANIVALVEALQARGYDAHLDDWDDEAHATIKLTDTRYVSIGVGTYSEAWINLTRDSAEDAVMRSSHSRQFATMRIGDDIGEVAQKIADEIGPPVAKLGQPGDAAKAPASPGDIAR